MCINFAPIGDANDNMPQCGESLEKRPEVVAASVTSALLAGEPYGIEKLIGTAMILTAGAVEALSERKT